MAASREERFAMRQRGAGVRQLKDSDFELALPGMARTSQAAPIPSSRKNPHHSRFNAPKAGSRTPATRHNAHHSTRISRATKGSTITQAEGDGTISKKKMSVDLDRELLEPGNEDSQRTGKRHTNTADHTITLQDSVPEARGVALDDASPSGQLKHKRRRKSIVQQIRKRSSLKSIEQTDCANMIKPSPITGGKQRYDIGLIDSASQADDSRGKLNISTVTKDKGTAGDVPKRRRGRPRKILQLPDDGKLQSSIQPITFMNIPAATSSTIHLPSGHPFNDEPDTTPEISEQPQSLSAVEHMRISLRQIADLGLKNDVANSRSSAEVDNLRLKSVVDLFTEELERGILKRSDESHQRLMQIPSINNYVDEEKSLREILQELQAKHQGIVEVLGITSSNTPTSRPTSSDRSIDMQGLLIKIAVIMQKAKASQNVKDNSSVTNMDVQSRLQLSTLDVDIVPSQSQLLATAPAFGELLHKLAISV